MQEQKPMLTRQQMLDTLNVRLEELENMTAELYGSSGNDMAVACKAESEKIINGSLRMRIEHKLVMATEITGNYNSVRASNSDTRMSSALSSVDNILKAMKEKKRSLEATNAMLNPSQIGLEFASQPAIAQINDNRTINNITNGGSVNINRNANCNNCNCLIF